MGFGINLLATDVERTADFLAEILSMRIHRADQDSAVLEHDGNFFQLHGEHTYHDNPFPGTLEGVHYRGAGVELRLYQKDPDACEARAKKKGYQVLRTRLDRPHGLRECFLLDPDEYCWVPSAPLAR
ncbi:MAG: glyoxalase [Candidatus Thioglobus sp. MED-G23]|nr:MAG: glyoxalase [Candidatus Thioglobus sp. MED-G23]